MKHWTIDDALDIDLTGIRRARLRLVGGSVSVVPTDGPAHLVVKDVANAAVEVRFEDGILTVVHEDLRARRFLARRGSTAPSATILLSLPADSDLDVAAVSADVLVAGLRAPTGVRTVSGGLTFKDIHADVDAKTVSGDVQTFGLHGALRFNTVSGDLRLVNGSCTRLSYHSVSGAALIDTAPLPQAEFDIATVSGDVDLSTPAEPDLALHLRTLSGDLKAEWDVAWNDERPGKRRLEKTFGTGSASMRVKTVSGDLRLRKRAAVA